MAELGATEAAAALGISRDTVYRRVKEGTLESTTDALGRMRVIVDDEVAVELVGRRLDDDTTGQELQQARAALALVEVERDGLLQQTGDLRQAVATLTSELVARREAERELRVLVQQAQQRIPSPTPPTSGMSDADGAVAGASAPLMDQPRRWWRRG